MSSLFVALVAQQSLELNWKKGKIAHEIQERCGQEGIWRLQQRTGLDAQYIERYIFFYLTFPDEIFHPALPYEFHELIAYHLQTFQKYWRAYAKDVKHESDERPPLTWLRMAESEHWTLDQFRSYLNNYYGLSFWQDQTGNIRAFWRLYEENPRQLHPVLKNVVYKAYQRFLAESVQEAFAEESQTRDKEKSASQRVVALDQRRQLKQQRIETSDSEDKLFEIRMIWRLRAPDKDQALNQVITLIQRKGIRSANQIEIAEIEELPVTPINSQETKNNSLS